MITRPLPLMSQLHARLFLHEANLYWRPISTRRATDVTWNKKHAGRRVGVPKGNGYEMFRLDGRSLLVHRVVFALAHGSDPGQKIVDHADGKRANNNPRNLRLATNMENVQHRNGPGANNTSGVVGVYWHKASGKWAASIRVNGNSIHLGLFTVIEKAVSVRQTAEIKHFRLKGTR